jgi:peptidoglycan/xylan/chitin deacetylase (PgdA/CDA1 family)
LILKRLLVSSLLLVCILATFYSMFEFSKSRTSQMFGELIARVETDKPIVALTLDDGPTADFTPEVLALLKAKNVSATFFVSGKEAEENSAQLRAIVEAGHEIGNHSYTHSYMTLMGPGTIAEEIERTDAAIRAAGFEGEIHFRPPYGKKLFSLPWYLSEHHRKTIMWDVEPESFPEIDRNAAAITRYVVDHARSGSIIIMHVMYDTRAASRAALPGIIDGLRSRGFRFVTVSELISDD